MAGILKDGSIKLSGGRVIPYEPLLKPEILKDADLDLFFQRISLIAWNGPLIAKSLRHQKPLGSLRDYLHPSAYKEREMSLAAQFMKDLMSKDTDYMIAKWYSSGPAPK